MRLPIVLVLLGTLAGCRTVSTGNGSATGAAAAEMAVVQFLSAARAQDLQAMSAVWGNSESPTRDRVDRTELERRLIIMACHLRHDESRVGAAQTGEGGRQVYRAELVQGTKNAATNFTAVRNTRSGRWYVEDFDLRPLAPFCTTPPTRR